MASQNPIPHSDVPLVDPKTGVIDADWYDYLSGLNRLKVSDLGDVSTTAPTNGQVMIYDATTKLWVPGAN